MKFGKINISLDKINKTLGLNKISKPNKTRNKLEKQK